MTAPVFVRAAHHRVLPARALRREPRPRFVEYQTDLHRMAGTTLDPATLVEGDQYTFVDLAEAVFDEVDADLLRGLDVLVTSYWTPEFDPDVSAFGPYLHHRYALECESFDVIDRGSLSPVLAVLVLGDYLRAGAPDADGLLLAVEQSTVPAATGAHVPGPTRSTAGVLRLTRRPHDAAAAILAVTSLGENWVLDPATGLTELAGRWCEEFDIDPAELTVVVRRGTFLYRKWARQWDGGDAPYQIRFLPSDTSCTTVFQWLSEVLAGTRDDGRCVVFVEEDVESLAAAAMLVRVTS